MNKADQIIEKIDDPYEVNDNVIYLLGEILKRLDELEMKIDTIK